MVVAWLFCSNLGIAFGRYLRLSPKPYPAWFPLHIAFNACALLLTLIGFIIIFMHVGSDDDPDHLSSLHAVVGLIIFISMFIQAGLGVLSHYKWSPQDGANLYDKWHWWIGRGVYVLAIINIFTGFSLFADEMDINGFVWFCFGMLITLVFFLTVGIEIHVFAPPARAHTFEVLDDQAPAVEQGDKLGYEVDASNAKIFKSLVIYASVITLFVFAVVIGLFTGISTQEEPTAE